jgi:DME family drug/metabolite transporter
LIAALTYSLYSWAAKKMIDQGIDSKASMGLILGFGALLLLPTLFLTASNLFDEFVSCRLYDADSNVSRLLVSWLCFK